MGPTLWGTPVHDIHLSFLCTYAIDQSTQAHNNCGNNDVERPRCHVPEASASTLPDLFHISIPYVTHYHHNFSIVAASKASWDEVRRSIARRSLRHTCLSFTVQNIPSTNRSAHPTCHCYSCFASARCYFSGALLLYSVCFHVLEVYTSGCRSSSGA